MAGRKPKLTDEVTETICQYVRVGNYMETAAAAGGVEARTVRIWLRHAAEARVAGRKNRYTKFADAVEAAQAEAEARDVTVISQAALADWKAAAWLLERKYPKRWAPRQTIEHELRKQEAELTDVALDRLRTEFDDDTFDRIRNCLGAGSEEIDEEV